MGRVSEGNKEERFAFIAEHGSHFGFRYLCRELLVSPAGFYRWRSRGDSERTKDNRALAGRIEELFDQHDGNYGSPRIYKALRMDGLEVNRKRVERLMRNMCLVGKAGRIYRRRPLPVNPCIVVGNKKRAIPAPEAPNRLWSGDVTYLKVNGDWCYLAVILDIYSRRIVGWSLGQSRTVGLTLSALRKALAHREVAPGLIFHSDRGAEYGAHVYQEELRRAGITASMNRPRHMTDNAHAESFFRTLKTESFKGLSFRSMHDLRMTLAGYIDDYYNTKRLHSSLGFNTPCNYENMVA